MALGFFTRVAAVPLAVHTGISAVYLQIIKNKATLHAPELEVMCLYTGLFLLLAIAPAFRQKPAPQPPKQAEEPVE